MILVGDISQIVTTFRRICMSEENIEKIREKMLHGIMAEKVPGRGNPTISKTPKILTDQNFVREISNEGLTVVDFWAPWCGPCRFVSPIIEELASDYAGKVSFGKLNVDENPMVSSQFMIRSIPTIMFFRNGKVVDTQIGAVPKPHLEQKIRKHLAL